MNKELTTKGTKNKAYPKYKPSGVEWLGDVPEHWVVKRTRFILSMNPSKQEISHLDPYTELAFLPMEAVGEEGSLRLDSMKPISEVNAGYTFFAEGDVAFAKITPCFENGKGAILRNLGTGFGFGTTELTVMRPSKQLDAEYLYYMSVSDDFRHNGEAWMYGAGGQKRVPDEFIKEFRFGFPPLPEQQAIASFLDRETGLIDSLIAKKQRLLELLAEQRTALISRAVTKGLEATVRLKPSGVDWLGDMPEHWEVKKLKFIGTSLIGLTYSPDEVVDEDYEGEKHLVLRSTNIQDGKISLHENVYVTTRVSKELKMRKLDILICARNGSRHLVGKNALIHETDDNMTFGAFTTVFRSKINPFLFYYFSSNQFQYQSTGFLTTTINQLTNGNLNSIIASIPPLPEQHAIAAFLDRETAKIDTLSAKVVTVIERLKEYRTALISSAVTGKIDVSTCAKSAQAQGACYDK